MSALPSTRLLLNTGMYVDFWHYYTFLNQNSFFQKLKLDNFEGTILTKIQILASPNQYYSIELFFTFLIHIF